jgi:hypothetical protein
LKSRNSFSSAVIVGLGSFALAGFALAAAGFAVAGARLG